MIRESTLVTYKSRINRIMDAVSADPTCTFTLENLAEIAGLSPFHLHRMFSNVMGEAPAVFVRRVRLLMAANALQFRPATSITDIAMECGFSSSQNFARAFKDWSGVSPGEFRRCCQLHQLPPKLEEQKSKFRKAAPFVLEYLAELEEQRAVSHHYIQQKGASMKVELQTWPDTRLAYVRHIGSYVDEGVPAAWGRIMAWGIGKGFMQMGGRSYGLSWDNPELTDRCRYDACIAVPSEYALDPSDAGIDLQTLEGGLYACYRRVVTRSQFSEAMNELFGVWLPQSGYECLGCPIELYHNSQNDSCNSNATWDLSVCVKVRLVG